MVQDAVTSFIANDSSSDVDSMGWVGGGEGGIQASM